MENTVLEGEARKANLGAGTCIWKLRVNPTEADVKTAQVHLRNFSDFEHLPKMQELTELVNNLQS